MSNCEIADRMGINRNTANSYVKALGDILVAIISGGKPTLKSVESLK
jgi:DNA-binding CsgD family transcriptional regulator